MYESCISLLAEYAARREPVDRAGAEVAREIALRLRHIRWLSTRIDELEKALLNAHYAEHGVPQPRTTVMIGFLPTLAPDAATSPLTEQETLQLFAETFYYSAHRILTVLDECANVLPGLKSVRAKGVRRVRNNLIEHANKKGGHSTYSFSLSNAAGVRLRAARLPEESVGFIDEGFRTNSSEFQSELESMLRAVAA
jgi:hypothetical protein